jgi:hypothetical protein
VATETETVSPDELTTSADETLVETDGVEIKAETELDGTEAPDSVTDGVDHDGAAV